MKKWILITAALFLFQISNGQNARVLLVKHELRWTNETRFPNYFLYTDIRDSIFSDTRQELIKKLQADEVTFPEQVEYKIIKRELINLKVGIRTDLCYDCRNDARPDFHFMGKFKLFKL